MKYQKKTLRRMRPVARRYAGLINELTSIVTRSGNLLKEIESLEADSRALKQHQCQPKAFDPPRLSLDLKKDSV